MTREQLEQVLRAAAVTANENPMVVVGSQAILLPFPNAPAALWVLREFDPARAPIASVSAWARRRAIEASP